MMGLWSFPGRNDRHCLPHILSIPLHSLTSWGLPLQTAPTWDWDSPKRKLHFNMMLFSNILEVGCQLFFRIMTVMVASSERGDEYQSPFLFDPCTFTSVSPSTSPMASYSILWVRVWGYHAKRAHVTEVGPLEKTTIWYIPEERLWKMQQSICQLQRNYSSCEAAQFYSGSWHLWLFFTQELICWML